MEAPNTQVRSLLAEHALLPDGWARQVRLLWNAHGVLTEVAADQAARPGEPRAAGLLLPGLPNLHSHAFQRAMAGLTECRGAGPDSFWSWREKMYRFAGAITPAQLEAVATGLYVEMLEAGYTSVCEFHYLHHAPDGRPYADDSTLLQCLLRAAQSAGIGLTLLPVLYQTSGFGGQPPSMAQRRLVLGTDKLLALLQTLAPVCAAQDARLGLAPHSLRAVPPDALHEAVAGMTAIDATAPIHIHVAEQAAEVEACLSWSGARPVQWLLDHERVDARWCLVHATHMDAAEYRAAAASGAVAGLCPSTEANLGDGLFDMPAWRTAGGRWGIGSDSHACVNAAEELMLLEYGQRLAGEQRNVMAGERHRWVATAMTLQAVAGGAQASARAVAGLAVGQQADWVLLDATHSLLCGLPDPDAMLSAHVFASHRRSAIAEVWTRGRPRVLAGRHVDQDAAVAGLVRARSELAAL